MSTPRTRAKLVVLFTLLGLIGQVQAYAGATINKSVPAMSLGSLQDMHGQDKLLQDYISNDKWLVVILWASDCQFSEKLVNEYNKHFSESNSKYIELLGVSLDGLNQKAAAKIFIGKHQLEFINLIGNRTSVTRHYGFMTGDEGLITPTLLLISPNGQLRARQIGAVPPKLIEDFIKTETLRAFMNKLALTK